VPAAVLACLRRRHAIPPLYACTCQDKTEFGRSVLDSSGPNAFDPEGFLGFVRGRVAAADATVLAYLAESLRPRAAAAAAVIFRRGSANSVDTLFQLAWPSPHRKK